MLQPIIPSLSKSLLDQLGIPDDSTQSRSFSTLTTISMPVGIEISSPYPVFPKIDLASFSDEMLKASTTNVNASINKDSTTGIVEKSTATSLDPNLLQLTSTELTDLITKVGEEVRNLKAQSVSKEELKPYVDRLLALKSRCNNELLVHSRGKTYFYVYVCELEFIH